MTGSSIFELDSIAMELRPIAMEIDFKNLPPSLAFTGYGIYHVAHILNELAISPLICVPRSFGAQA